MLRQPDGSWSIENHNPVAEFLQPGTRMMFRRPIDDAVREWWERERYNRVMAVLHRIGL